MARQPTIKDVAATAGVSFKTVSRVLNGEAHVREELRAKVKAAVEALGYHPSVAARGLIGAPSRLLAFLYDNPNFGYVTEAELGILRGCRSAGYYVAVEPVVSGPDIGDQIDRILSSLRVDGVILTPPLSDDPATIAAIEQRGVRCVRIAAREEISGYPNISVDDAQGAYTLTSRMLDLGHRHIAFVKGPPEHGASQWRIDGYRRAMRDRGIEVVEALVATGDFTFESGFAAAQTLLQAKPRPTAVFASNDQMALGVMAAALEAGLDLPKELSIGGFDDIRVARMSWPPLTTVRQPIADMCAAAAEMLIEAAGGRTEHFASRALATDLIERGSLAEAT